MMHCSKCFVTGRDFSNGGFARKAHLHIYCKVEVKIKLKDFKERMQNHGLCVNDIQSCKYTDSALRYGTKKALVPFNCGGYVKLK